MKSFWGVRRPREMIVWLEAPGLPEVPEVPEAPEEPDDPEAPEGLEVPDDTVLISE